MRMLALLLLTAALADPGRWWMAAPLGAPAPTDLRPEHDPPWAGATPCGWLGELLLCADADGRVVGAYRRHAEVVQGGARLWLQTAGLEWRSGYRVAGEAADGVTVWRWGQHRAPLDGWDVATIGPEAAEAAPAEAARSVAIEGGEALGDAARTALSRCPGAALRRLPAVVLYDASGEARLVRFQAFPPEGAALGCVATALGAPEGPAGGAIEVMVSVD